MINLKANDWEIKNIDTVLFDKDGTFIDLHYFWGRMTELRCEAIIKQFDLNSEIFSKLCLHLGYDFYSKKMLCDGITALYSRSKIIQIFKNDLLLYGVEITEIELERIFDNVSNEFYKNIYEYTKPINEAINFIKLLKSKGIKLGIVTSDSVESTKLILEYFDWNDLFDVVVGRESSSETKESGALTKLALSEINSNPKTTLMIGDAPMDYISAKNAGVENIILVSTGQINTNDLLKTHSNVVDSLSLIKII